jgi:uncharacterized lipoprotein YmbA
MSRYVAETLALIVLTSLWGCSTSAPATFYTLSPAQGVEQHADVKDIAIAIDRVTIPELIDRPQIVSELDANRVSIDDFARWGAPLKDQIARVLADDLARTFPNVIVTAYPERADEGAYRVSVDVQTFMSSADHEVTLSATWSVRSPTGGSPIRGRTVAHETGSGTGYDGLVNAQSRALASLASEIAAAVQTGRGRRA